MSPALTVPLGALDHAGHEFHALHDDENADDCGTNGNEGRADVRPVNRSGQLE
jgi:hypothetical protein